MEEPMMAEALVKANVPHTSGGLLGRGHEVIRWKEARIAAGFLYYQPRPPPKPKLMLGPP
jgi:hypothetical protein